MFFERELLDSPTPSPPPPLPIIIIVIIIIEYRYTASLLVRSLSLALLRCTTPSHYPNSNTYSRDMMLAKGTEHTTYTSSPRTNYHSHAHGTFRTRARGAEISLGGPIAIFPHRAPGAGPGRGRLLLEILPRLALRLPCHIHTPKSSMRSAISMDSLSKTERLPDTSDLGERLAFALQSRVSGL